MPKASPLRNIFSGEISELAMGRTDSPRYAQSMRTMTNCVGSPLGPAIRRPGTVYQGKAISDVTKSRLQPFVFNEDEVCCLEFGANLLRFWYEYTGLAANREFAATAVVANNPLRVTIPGHDYTVGLHVVLTGFAATDGIDGSWGTVSSVVGNDIIFSDLIGHGTPGARVNSGAAVVYELVTPYAAADLPNISVVQWLDVVYVFCTPYRIYQLKRFDTFNWTLGPMAATDGPYLPINDTGTKMMPLTKGSWLPDMTSNTAPLGVAAADTEAAGHEAFRAFDADPLSFWEGTANQKGWIEYQFANLANNNVVPIMTGPSTAGVTMSATSQQTGFEAWKARDGTNDTDWFSNGTVPQALQVLFPSAHTIRSYTMRSSRKQVDYDPKAWTLEGSNNGIAWTVLDTHSGEVFDSGEKRHFPVATPGSYIYYRINVSAVSQHYHTQKIKAVGKPNKPGYVKAHTVTTLSTPKVRLANIELIEDSSDTFKAVNGYTMHVGMKNDEAAADSLDHAPRSWTFEGWDGANWFVLDSKRHYEDWHLHRTNHFDIKNKNAYRKYRINITEVQTHGAITPRVGLLTFSSPDAPPVVLHASSRININDDQGFQPSDIGRPIRLRDYDEFWRWGKIVSYTDETTVGVDLQGDEPLLTTKQIADWRLGYWSDTTGYPSCGTVFEERLWCAGTTRYPDTVFASEQGLFSHFRQSTYKDEVFDDSAIIVRCSSRKMSRALWMAADTNAVIVGTGSGEYVVFAPTDEPLTSRNVAARPASQRGSAAIEPIVVDTDILFVHRSKRRLYTVGFNVPGLEKTDKYDSFPISLMAGHLAHPHPVELTYEQAPFSIIWSPREDGTFIGMTYEKATDIVGGHKHYLDGGKVEAMCATPSPADAEDCLWFSVLRTIDGLPVRYIERMGRYWDQDMILADDATFLDCSLRLRPAAASQDFYGLWHLEGQKVDVLADGLVYRELVVTGGHIRLPQPCEDYLVIGKGYKTDGEITGLEDAAADGTAQGKSKRPHNVVIRVWDSFLGAVGRYNEDQGQTEYTPIEYPIHYDALTPIILQTAMVGPLVLPQGYGKLGSVFFHQEDPLPMNVVAIYPQMYTSDRQSPQGA